MTYEEALAKYRQQYLTLERKSQLAYQIWEDDGRPDGNAPHSDGMTMGQFHWWLAELILELMVEGDAAKESGYDIEVIATLPVDQEGPEITTPPAVKKKPFGFYPSHYAYIGVSTFQAEIAANGNYYTPPAPQPVQEEALPNPDTPEFVDFSDVI